jgi:hypothetical protein
MISRNSEAKGKPNHQQRYGVEHILPPQFTRWDQPSSLCPWSFRSADKRVRVRYLSVSQSMCANQRNKKVALAC